MRIAFLQLNPTVGAMAENTDRLVEFTVRARAQGADLAVAPELCVPGYPPKDLLDRPSFVEAAHRYTAKVVASVPQGLTLVFGSLGHDPRGLTNDAVVASSGREIARAKKQLLPSYDVFDEARHFEAGTASRVVEVAGKRVWLSVCEDAWAESPLRPKHSALNPLAGLTASSADLLVNVSASPFTLTKLRERPQMFAEVACRHGVPVAFVNQVGGDDELIFDGRSSLWSATGVLQARAAAFAEDLVTVNWNAGGSIAAEPDSDEAAAYQALLLGVRDYARKCGFRRAVLGLSGGIDSALTAVIAADALGPENVLGVAMPTRYSSPGSVTDARALAQNLGIDWRLVEVDPIFTAYLSGFETLLGGLPAPSRDDVTLENIQARIRAATLMAISNRSGALVLTTGNKSELAVGYCTLYGDMVGGLAVISDLPKTLVYRVARYLNRERERIPLSSLTKPPSAELKPDQTDQDTLPPYDLLDAVLELYVEEQLGAEAIVARGFDPVLVRRVVGMIERAEYKRRQAAPGLILTRKAFGPGRRMPVASGYKETN